ncbi:hypothetical protein [Streptomyces flaveus]|nr:hypothetical protein [Streptomyces flaveus]
MKTQGEGWPSCTWVVTAELSAMAVTVPLRNKLSDPYETKGLSRG